MVLDLILQAVWLIIPAYAANGFPPLLKGSTPLDRGRTFRGRRVFGEGKTIRGTIGGIAFGTIIGLIQITGQSYLPADLGLVEMSMPLVLLLTVGTMVGDILGSFLKRQIGMERGASLPIVDQDGFVVFALLLAALVYPAPIEHAIILMVITPPIHLLSNIGGYLIHVKKQPW